MIATGQVVAQEGPGRPVPPARPRVLMTGMAWFADQPGGLDRYFEALLGGLRQEGCDVRAVAVGGARSCRDERGVSAPSLVGRLGGFRREVGSLVGDCDVVDAHFALHATAGLSRHAVRTRPLVVHFQGPWSEESAVEGAGRATVVAKAAIERLVYGQAAACVVLCRSFGDVLEQRYGVEPARVHVVRPGVDLDRFHRADRREARGRLGFDPDRPTLLTVRRLVRRTGVDVLLDALALVRHEVPEVHLVVAGDGRQRSALAAQAEQLGLAGHVTFLGRVADDVLPALYQAADVSVVPSRALEGFGLVTLESLACGTPVVVTDVDGLADVPRELDPSCVVPPGDVGSLADRIAGALVGRAALAGPARCRQLAEAHSWAHVSRRHLDLYDRLLTS